MAAPTGKNPNVPDAEPAKPKIDYASADVMIQRVIDTLRVFEHMHDVIAGARDAENQKAYFEKVVGTLKHELADVQKQKDAATAETKRIREENAAERTQLRQDVDAERANAANALNVELTEHRKAADAAMLKLDAEVLGKSNEVKKLEAEILSVNQILADARAQMSKIRQQSQAILQDVP